MNRLGLNVLIVDDVPEIREYLADSLKEFSLNLIEAPSIESAKEELLNTRIALAIVDINMPDGSGIDLLEFMKMNCPQITTIMLTASSDKNDLIKSLSYNVFDYIEKPFNINSMQESVAKGLGLAQHYILLETLVQTVGIDQGFPQHTLKKYSESANIEVKNQILKELLNKFA